MNTLPTPGVEGAHPATLMNPRFSLPLAAGLLLTLAACNRPADPSLQRIAELERKAAEAVERQAQLELELQQRELAGERDAIERERMAIEQQRFEAERLAGEEALAAEQAIRERELALTEREGGIQQTQSDLIRRENEVVGREQQLQGRELEIAGREALPSPSRQPSFNQNLPVADYGTFYDSLSSYGSWFETPNYGYVWQPAAVRQAGWRPYTRGRWVCSDRGWTFVSNEPFGWATYHYGRWALLSRVGWIWVPGTEWAPSWVCWRESGSHVGWAPLPPETLAWRGHRWDSSVETRFGISSSWFSFVAVEHFAEPAYRHFLPVSQNNIFIRQTTNITNIHIRDQRVISGGPGYQQISDRMGRPMPFYRLDVDHHRRPGRDPLSFRPQISGDRLRFNAPDVSADWNGALRPPRVRERLQNVRV